MLYSLKLIPKVIFPYTLECTHSVKKKGGGKTKQATKINQQQQSLLLSQLCQRYGLRVDYFSSNNEE